MQKKQAAEKALAAAQIAAAQKAEEQKAEEVLFRIDRVPGLGFRV